MQDKQPTSGTWTPLPANFLDLSALILLISNHIIQIIYRVSLYHAIMDQVCLDNIFVGLDLEN